MSGTGLGWVHQLGKRYKPIFHRTSLFKHLPVIYLETVTMKRKHAITTAIVVLILGTLVYVQFRHWRTFNWHQFWEQTKGINLWMILIAVGLTYFVYFLRAIRWSIFLKPTKHVPVSRLIAPQIVGFTGLALLGRPGELVRPYLIARRENLSFASQLAVWAVERVFDIASVALLLGLNLALSGGRYKRYPMVGHAGFAMLAIAVVLSLTIFALWWKATVISSIIEKITKPISDKFANAICSRVRSFGGGLNTLQNFRSFVSVALLSILIWVCVAEAYIHVTHSYPSATVQVEMEDDDGNSLPPETRTVRLHRMQLPDVLLVMGASMLGSVVQLPGVGGGSQLAVISLLHSDIFSSEPYNVTEELAVSCGMMLWLVTFMSVIPLGLLLAHRERISLRAISEESECEQQHPKPDQA